MCSTREGGGRGGHEAACSIQKGEKRRSNRGLVPKLEEDRRGSWEKCPRMGSGMGGEVRDGERQALVEEGRLQKKHQKKREASCSSSSQRVSQKSSQSVKKKGKREENTLFIGCLGQFQMVGNVVCVRRAPGSPHLPTCVRSIRGRASRYLGTARPRSPLGPAAEGRSLGMTPDPGGGA